MTNIFEATLNSLIMSMESEPKAPLHIGEAFACWMYMGLMDEARVFIQMGLNTTTVAELVQMLEDSLKQCEAQSRQLKDFMKKEGIHLPPTTEERPKSEPNAVPLGVKMTDDEIANGVSIKTVTVIVHTATSSAQTIRNDLGTMWVHFLNEKMVFGQSLKALMVKRGWIKVPPYYYPPGLPN